MKSSFIVFVCGVALILIVFIMIIYEVKSTVDVKNIRLQMSPDSEERNTNKIFVPTPQTLNHYKNPGCLREGWRTLSDYKTIDTGVTYHHPSVVQYAKLSNNGKPVSLIFRDYMAIMSAYKFLQPERIIIHTYGDIEGKYWDLIQKWNTTHTKVEVNKVQRVSQFGKNRVRYIEHAADYIKLQGLLKFGGITTDFDVIIVNGIKIRQLQNISECVLSQETAVVAIGFNSCIKNSTFIQKWLDSYHTDYRPGGWTYNSASVPAEILLHGRICYNFHLDYTVCNNPGYIDAPRRWLIRNGVEWRSKIAAHYYTKHDFKYDDERLLDKDDSFGDMLRYVNKA